MPGFFAKRTQCIPCWRAVCGDTQVIGFAGALESLAMDFVGSVNNFALIGDADNFAFVEFHLPV